MQMKNEKLIHTAMILTAGLGKRMGDLTESLPKPLLSIQNRTLLDLALIKLSNAGIQKVVLNLHHQAMNIKEHLNKNHYPNLKIIYSEEEQLLGTGGGIAYAEKYFGSESVLIMNSDILSDISLRKFINFYFNSAAIATMAVLPSKNSKDYSLITYSPDQILSGFLEKNVKTENLPNTGIFMGYQILSKTARNYLKPKFSSVIYDFYLQALKQNIKIPVYNHSGEWIDIGTKEYYHHFIENMKKNQIILDKYL